MATEYRRAKSRFATARQAWQDVAKSVPGLRPGDVVSDHTGTHFVFKAKARRSRSGNPFKRRSGRP